MNPLEVDERTKHKFVLGILEKGWGCVALSSETKAGLVNGGVKYVKELVLTKEEHINEFKVGLRKGYFK